MRKKKKMMMVMQLGKREKSLMPETDEKETFRKSLRRKAGDRKRRNSIERVNGIMYCWLWTYRRIPRGAHWTSRWSRLARSLEI